VTQKEYNVITKENKDMKPCKDHLGNEFKSTAEMCRFYDVSKQTYGMRLKRNWSLEEALEGRKHKITIRRPNKRGIKCQDHLGNEYISVAAMCKAWNIERSVFQMRRKSNWTLPSSFV
jgi:hypothetical protein